MRRRLLVGLILAGVLGSLVGGSVGFALGGQGERVLAQIGPSIPSIIGTDRLAASKPPAKFPAKGKDAFGSIAEFEILQAADCSSPFASFVMRLAGPTVVQRGPRQGALKGTIDTEIVAMDLTGFHPQLGQVTIRESAEFPSTGKVREKGSKRNTDFPAASFFDVFVEIQVGGQTLHNSDPVRLRNSRIFSLPPIGSEYRTTSVQPVPLFLPDGTFAGHCIRHAVHVPEDPSHVLILKELFAIQEPT